MHTAQIANLPPHPIPAETKQEAHGDDFTIHLREKARDAQRQDEPRSPARDRPERSTTRPRAPEENHQRLPPDDRSAPVAESKIVKEPDGSSDGTDMPSADTESSDSGPALDGSESTPASPETQAAVQPGTAETNVAPHSSPNLLNTVTNAATQETGSNVIAATTVTPASAVAETAKMVAGADPNKANAASAAAQGDVTSKSESVPDMPTAASDKKSALSVTAPQAVAPSTSPTTPEGTGQLSPPVVNLTSPTAAPAEGNALGQTATAAVVAATALRTGTGAPGQTDTSNAMPNDIAENAMAASDGVDGNRQTIAASTNKASGISTTNNQNGQQTGATTNGEVATGDMNMTDAKPKDLSALKDMAVRGNDVPVQSNTSATSQSMTTGASTFGSELKFAADASPTSQTAAARNLPNAAANQVAVQINRAVQDGQEKFVVNLKPATLGKVSVQLEVGHDNRVIAVIAAERPDTLELLQRDSRALELALKEAGLKADSGSLSFNLQGNGAEDSSSDDPSDTRYSLAIPQDGEELDTLPKHHTHTYAADASGVDIHV